MRYKFDALGRRVQRIYGNGKENTKFIHDGLDVLVDDNGGTLTKYLNGEGIDEKLRQTNGTGTSYFLADHLGSTNGLTDANGSLTASTAYDSFGNATNASFPSRYQFTGREYDGFSGLHHYRARSYDGNLGRFASEDPIGFAGRDVNLYVYVHNQPLMFRDPSGKIAPVVLIIAGAVVGAAVGATVYYLVTPACKRTAWGWAGAAAGGAVVGGIAVVAVPIAGGLGLGTGLFGTAVVNAGAGIAGAGVTAALDPDQDFTPTYAAGSGIFGALGGAIGGAIGPARGMSNFSQVGFPRTVPGVIPSAIGGRAGANAMNVLYRGGIPSNAIGSAGPTLVSQQLSPQQPCECNEEQR